MYPLDQKLLIVLENLYYQLVPDHQLLRRVQYRQDFPDYQLDLWLLADLGNQRNLAFLMDQSHLSDQLDQQDLLHLVGHQHLEHLELL